MTEFESVNLAIVTGTSTAVLLTEELPRGIRDLAIYVKPAAYAMHELIVSLCPVSFDYTDAKNYATIYTDAQFVSGTAVSSSNGVLVVPITTGIYNAAAGYCYLAWVRIPPAKYIRISGHSATADTVDIILCGGKY